jgi:poly(3-hydroxybutyrate) depolymerase
LLICFTANDFTNPDATPPPGTNGQEKDQTLLYYLYEMNHAAMAPARTAAGLASNYLRHPLNPASGTMLGKTAAAGFDVFERLTRRYGKPAFGLSHTVVDGEEVEIRERVVWQKPFCRLLHFERDFRKKRKADPKLLIVAPLSGHYATLLRGTVETMLPDHDVYITDWTDARRVPLSDGGFDLDDYIDYLIDICHQLGRVHMMAVCQPSVPVLAAVAAMSSDKDPMVPLSMTLMGGPVDTRVNPTAVNKFAVERGTDWLARHAIVTVPFPNPGMMRRVYPGFLQLSGFMGMNFDQHISAHHDFFLHLVEGDGDSAAKHEAFYDEYLSVLDMTEAFYLQTVERVFVEHALPRGRFRHRDRLVEPQAITKTALLTIEGAMDDISGQGQTQAAHDLCSGLHKKRKQHYLHPEVGHYGVFNGSRFRRDIAPRIRQFIRRHRR